MATTPKIVREVVATTVQEQSKSQLNGWDLNFIIQKDGDKVRNVNVYGSKDGANVNASVNEQGYVNIGFSSGSRDNILTTAILDELETITAVAE